VSKCYPTSSAGFAGELMTLLEEQQARLDAALRRSMVQALILLRNRNQVRSTTCQLFNSPFCGDWLHQKWHGSNGV
jgi:hypothetical protein